MNNQNSTLEARLEQASKELPYPATPDVADRILQQLATPPTTGMRPLQRLAIALAAIILGVIGLLTVPPVRASILEFLQIGSVRIWLADPTAAPTAMPTNTPGSAVGATRATDTPRPTETPVTSLHRLAGETTLDEAQARSTFTIRLPAYPADLGAPDRVYQQDMPATTIVLVWLDEANEVRLSLHILTEGAIAYKMHPTSLQETTVHGEQALWTMGPYWLQMDQSSLASFRLIDGHTLIWVQDTLTYRLETDLPLAEAVKVAESLE